MTIRVYDIEWDLIDEETGREVDREEEGLPIEAEFEIDDNTVEVVNEIANKLSDGYGFSAISFNWEIVSHKELKDKIRAVLRRYFECNDNGDENPEFDEYFSAEDAIDEIHDIIGEI